jgi:hypothetical protein
MSAYEGVLGSDCVGNEEEHNFEYFYVDPAEPWPEITDPIGEPHDYPAWYYRPGHKIDLDYILTNRYVDRKTVKYYEWQFSIEPPMGDGDWITIWEGCGDGLGLVWDTGLYKDILEPYVCCDNPQPVWVKLKVWDDHCRNGTDIVQVWFCRELNPQPCVQTITIVQGWNLISFAVGLDSFGDNYFASTLAYEMNRQSGNTPIKYVVRYDYYDGEFHEWVVDSHIGDNFLIEQGEGYYVYSISAYEFDFTIVGDCKVCETFDLEVCWNLVGWDSQAIMTDAEFAAQINDYVGADVIQAIAMFVESGSGFPGDMQSVYLAWYPGMESVFDMVPGKAYWIFSAVKVEDAYYDYEPMYCPGPINGGPY